jgi:hypothetical protein
MSSYYHRRTRNLFNPTSPKPFTLSRSKLELYVECPRCFYLDRRLGIGRIPGYPFLLNSAVDKLLKKEFDTYRVAHVAHPLFETFGINAIPFTHEELEQWRLTPSGGATYLHRPTNLLIKGVIDDIWLLHVDSQLVIADYKATAKSGEVSIDAPWQSSYKRQMEIYQWIFRRNGFTVADTAYFVYCNGKTQSSAFDAKLEFDIKLIPYKGDDSWVEATIINAHQTLMNDEPPLAVKECDWCAYFEARAGIHKSFQNKKSP